MRSILTIICAGLFFANSFAQTSKPEYEGFSELGNKQIPFYNEEGNMMKNPFAGGLIKPSFGNIDLNRNGIQDLVILDREDDFVMTFINEGEPGNPEFRYAPAYAEALPDLENFIITRDYNHNGNMDIFTYQSGANFGVKVYQNTSDDDWLDFEVAVERLERRNGTNIRISNTDIPGVADVTGDGALDFFSFSQLGGFVEFFQNMSYQEYGHYDSLIFDKKDACWGRFFELTDDTANFNLGEYRDWCLWEGGKKHQGGAMLLLDVNQSGAKDILISDADQSNIDLLINGKTLIADDPYPIDSMIEHQPDFPSEHPVDINFKPGAYYVDVDNSGVNDMIFAPADQRPVQSVNQIWYYRNRGENDNPDLEFVQDNFLQEGMIDEGTFAIPRFIDVNQNGLKDLLVTANRGFDMYNYQAPQMMLYLNQGDSSNPEFKKADDDFAAGFELPVDGFIPAFGDLNDNGKIDMVAGNINGTIDFYENIGEDSLVEFELKNHQGFEDVDAGQYSAPYLYDFNGNGLLDLFVGNQRGTVHYYENKGTPESPDFEKVTDSLGKIWVADSYVTSGETYYRDGFSAPSLADLNGDGTPEIIVGSEARGVLAYRTDPENPDAEFEHIDSLFISYDRSGAVADIIGKRLRPDAAVLQKDSLPVIFKGTARGGMLGYDTNAPEDTTVVNRIDNPEPETTDWKLFPNPAQSSFIIKSDVDMEIRGGKLQVFDMTGREVKSKEVHTSDGTIETNVKADWHNKIYIVRLTDKNGKMLYTDKLIIEQQ